MTQTTTGTDTYTLGATSMLSKAITNEFRLGYTGSSSRQLSSLDTFGGADPSKFMSASGIGNQAAPGVYYYMSFYGSGTATLDAQTTESSLRQWNLVDTVSMSRGKHIVKAGIDYRHLVSTLSPAQTLVQAAYFDPASVLANDGTIYLSKQLGARPLYNETAAFVQDEWRLRPSLNLSLGVRWEVDPAVGEANGNLPYALTGSLTDPSSLQFAARGTPLFDTAWYNFAPRLGVAWTAHDLDKWRTVVRAGGGVFYDLANQIAARGFYSVGFVAYQTLSPASLPIVPSQLQFSPSADPPYTGAVVYAYPKHLQMPYTLEWNVALEQALGDSQSLTLNYVASNGRRLLSFQQYSLFGLSQSFGTVDYIPNGITSNYQALQVKFQRSVTKGLQALASYTWAHSLDYGSTYAAITQTRGNSDFDVRNEFNAGLSWDILTSVSRGLIGKTIAHWGADARVTARDAFPVTLDGYTLTDPTTGNQFYGGLNRILGEPVYLHGSQYPGGKAIDPAAFAVATGTEEGTAPRNFIRGFGEFQVNAALRREFPIRESARLLFRAEAFNLSNRPNFGYIDPFYGDATFGQVTKMLNQSLVSVASQYQEGGPRSLQFALKLSF